MLLRNLAPILTSTKNWTGVELLCAILLTHIKVSNLGMVLTFSVTIGIIVAWCALLILSKYLFIFSPLFFWWMSRRQIKDTKILSCRKNQKEASMENLRKKFFLASLVYSTHIIQMSLFEESPPPYQAKTKFPTLHILMDIVYGISGKIRNYANCHCGMKRKGS